MREETPAWLGHALHELSQPLTALECILHLGLLPARARETSSPDVADLRMTVEQAMIECRRLFILVRAMQAKTQEMSPTVRIGSKNKVGRAEKRE